MQLCYLFNLQVRHQYQSAWTSAYVVGTLLSVLVAVVWPAVMLVAGVFSCSGFKTWTILVIVLAIVSAMYLGLVPPIAEIVKVWKLSKVCKVDNCFFFLEWEICI